MRPCACCSARSGQTCRRSDHCHGHGRPHRREAATRAAAAARKTRLRRRRHPPHYPGRGLSPCRGCAQKLRRCQCPGCGHCALHLAMHRCCHRAHAHAHPHARARAGRCGARCPAAANPDLSQQRHATVHAPCGCGRRRSWRRFEQARKSSTAPGWFVTPKLQIWHQQQPIGATSLLAQLALQQVQAQAQALVETAPRRPLRRRKSGR